jgi:hypothetical protein
MIERFKNIVEILAIFVGAAFIFFTWGVDQKNLREPSWNIKLDPIGGDRLTVTDEKLEACVDRNECKTVACKYSGTIKFENNSTNPVELGNTEIEIFTVPKFINDGEELSPYSIHQRFCKPNPDTRDCQNVPIFKTTIGSVDNSPLYAGVEAWRPFSFLVKKENTEKYLLENSFLVVATQHLSYQHPWKFWQQEPHESKSIYFDNYVCGFGAQQKTLK